MKSHANPGLLFLTTFAICSVAAAQTFVRVHDGKSVPARGAVPGQTSPGTSAGGPENNCQITGSFGFAALAWHNQTGPEGGRLSPLAPANPAMINDSGQIAFIASVTGQLRNQGVFVADENGLRAVALGCGGGGGSGDPGTGVGDPTPIGGTFAGFFGGTVFAPPINNAGDVLFIADVDGGSSIRGLFLYRAAIDQILSIAAVGDSSPVGGTITAVGPGAMNDTGEIVFLAQNSGTNHVNILKWVHGAVTKHVAVGDPVPGGGTFALLAGESFGFADGTSIPSGDVPGINDAGQVSFFGITSGAQAGRGLFVTTGGVHAWYVDDNDPSPLGGTFLDFQAPLLNESGEIAYFADIRLPGNEFTSGWFVSTPGSARKAAAFYDVIDGGDLFGLAFSRNPINGLDDCGNLLMWCVLNYSGTERDTLLLIPPAGDPVIVAQEGQPNVLGGTIGGMNAWPAMNAVQQGMLSCYTPGTPGSIFNAHFVFSGRPPGDLNCDGVFDGADIDPFFLALGDPAGYEQQFPDCDPLLGDMNDDGSLDGADIDVFFACLGGNCP